MSSNYAVSWKKSDVTLDRLSSLHFFLISTLKHSHQELNTVKGVEKPVGKDKSN